MKRTARYTGNSSAGYNNRYGSNGRYESYDEYGDNDRYESYDGYGSHSRHESYDGYGSRSRYESYNGYGSRSRYESYDGYNSNDRYYGYDDDDSFDDYDRYDAQNRKKSIFRIPTIVLVTVILVAAIIMAVCGCKLTAINNSYEEADEVYEEINRLFVLNDDESGITGEEFQWNYDTLLGLCEDAVGYIYQKDIISYPIVQASDNEKYLRHMMNGEYNVAGTIFVDARFPEGLEGNFSIVYGHNMYNVTMFGTLPEYTNREYYEKHPTFDIFVGYKHYKYYVFSAFVAEAEGYIYSFDQDNGDYKALFDRLRNDGEYKTDFRELTADDHVIVLSTCVNWHDYDYRNVVCLVRGEEITDW